MSRRSAGRRLGSPWMVGVAVLLSVLTLSTAAPSAPLGNPRPEVPTLAASPVSDSAPAATGLGPWTNLTGSLPGGPGPRSDAAAAWDGADQELVTFGGIPSGGGALRTTWAFQAGDWVPLTPRNPTNTDAPSARLGATMAYDAPDGYVVLFGGRGVVGGLLNDTWKFVHGNWTNITGIAGPAPPPRVNASMAYDPALGAVVLFGGRSPSTLYNDTWEFRGGQWHVAGAPSPTPTNTPPRRYAAALGFSTSANALVLFGGFGFQSGTYPPLSDTWEFGSAGWSPVPTSSYPSARGAVAFSPLPNGTLLLFGGAGGASGESDTWYFTSSGWSNVSASLGTPPSGRSWAVSAPIAVNATLGYILMFGGTTANGPTADTWAVGANTIVATRGVAFPASLDVNETTHLTISAFGPSAALSYSWTSKPAGCTAGSGASSSVLTCVPPVPGNFTAIVAVSANGSSAALTSSIPYVVSSLPSIRTVRVSPYPLVLGQGPLTLTVTAVGGTGNLRYAYSGLPIGCTSNDTSFLRCTPLDTGTWTVEVTVRDATNASVSANASVVVTTSSPTPPSKLLAKLTSPLAIAGAVVGVGVILLILYYVQRRRRRPPEEEEMPEGASTEYRSPPPIR